MKACSACYVLPAVRTRMRSSRRAIDRVRFGKCLWTFHDRLPSAISIRQSANPMDDVSLAGRVANVFETMILATLTATLSDDRAYPRRHSNFRWTRKLIIINRLQIDISRFVEFLIRGSGVRVPPRLPCFSITWPSLRSIRGSRLLQAMSFALFRSSS